MGPQGLSEWGRAHEAASCWLEAPCWLSHLPLLPSSGDEARGMGHKALCRPPGSSQTIHAAPAGPWQRPGDLRCPGRVPWPATHTGRSHR